MPMMKRAINRQLHVPNHKGTHELFTVPEGQRLIFRIHSVIPDNHQVSRIGLGAIVEDIEDINNRRTFVIDGGQSLKAISGGSETVQKVQICGYLEDDQRLCSIYVPPTAEEIPPEVRDPCYVPGEYYVIFLGLNDKNIGTFLVKENEDSPLPIPPEETGYHFAEWDGNHRNITEQRVIRAVYAPTDDDIVVVTFVGPTGLELASYELNKGGSVPELPTPPIHYGNDFAGWQGVWENVHDDQVVYPLYADACPPDEDDDCGHSQPSVVCCGGGSGGSGSGGSGDGSGSGDGGDDGNGGNDGGGDNGGDNGGGDDGNNGGGTPDDGGGGNGGGGEHQSGSCAWIEGPMIWRMETGSDKRIYVPFRNFTGTIDYGDGNVVNYSNENLVNMYTYDQEGTYDIKVTGEIGSFAVADGSTELKDVSQWGTQCVIKDYRKMFKGREAFTISAPDCPKFGTFSMGEYGTSTKEMFMFAQKFTENLSHWDMSQVTAMEDMFANSYLFNGECDGWDLRNCKSIDGMYRGAYAFNKPLNNWQTRGIENMSKVFMGAKAFNQPLDNWDTFFVTQMHWMFSGAYTYNQDLSGWCVMQVAAFHFYEGHLGADENDPDSWDWKAEQRPQWGTCP